MIYATPRELALTREKLLALRKVQQHLYQLAAQQDLIGQQMIALAQTQSAKAQQEIQALDAALKALPAEWEAPKAELVPERRMPNAGPPVAESSAE